MTNNVAKYRKAAGITQKELAETVGISRKAIITIESGKECRVSTAIKIADALNVPVRSLFLL